MDPEIIAAFIGPVFTAMLAGAGIVIKSIQVRNREQHARARDLEVATRTVDFINTYLAAQDKLLPREEQQLVRDRALRDLEVAYQTMMATASADYHNDSSGAWIRVIKRALLLGLNRTAAKVVRDLLLHLHRAELLFFGLWMGAGSPTRGDARHPGDDRGDHASASVGFLLPPVLLYIWARWLDRDRTPADSPAAAAADPMLGHYGNWQPVPADARSAVPGPMPGYGPRPDRHGPIPGVSPRR